MKLYENIFIARQDISTAQVEALVEKFTDTIQKEGGKVVNVEHWGLRTLAYRINKNRKGHYVMLHIEAPGTLVQELERTMRINEDILRYLTTQVEKFCELPSAVMRRDASREDTGYGSRGPRHDHSRHESAEHQPA